MKIKRELDRDGRLFVQLQEIVPVTSGISKVHGWLQFSDGEQDRLYPMQTQFVTVGEGQICVSATAMVELEYVFLYGSAKKTITVVPQLLWENTRKEFSEAAFTLDGTYFARTRSQKLGIRTEVADPLRLADVDRKKPFGVKVHGFFMWITAICSLPIMLMEGYLAQKDYFPLQLEGKTAKGKKAVIFHANNKIRRFTGVSFSVREFKTNYFAKKYDKYCRKPVKSNQVLFLSERRVEENGNLDLVRNALKQESQVEVVEFLETATVDKLSFGQLRRAAKLAAASKVIVLEDFYPQLHALNIRKETKVVQLWHACGAFKTFGFTRLGKAGGPEANLGNHRNYDQVYVSGSGIVPFYSEAFAIPEKNVLPIGVPRTDIFFDAHYKESMKEKWYEKYPEWVGKKMVMFAPTFRGAGNKEAFYPFEMMDIGRFMKSMPEDCILILKHHPFIKEKMEIPKEYENRVFDLSEGAAINELLFLTDLLITDYSSSIFEAALLRIPMVFYVFDKEAYLEERDIYGDFDQFVPGKQAKTQEELELVVKEVLEKEKNTGDLAQFREMYLSALDGNSTRRVTEQVIGLMK